MSKPPQYPIILHVDPEHSGIRFAVLLILFIALWLGFFLLSRVLRVAFPELESVFILACLGALPIALLAAGVGERVLKQRWHSGRRLVIREDAIRLERPDDEDPEVARGKFINQLWWYFQLSGYPRGGRERRIPAKWFCLAGQLQQDEERLVVFCYAPPKRQEEWVERFAFRRLDPAEIYDTSVGARLTAPRRPEITPGIVAGKDGKYWLAERNRWRAGVELSPDDFELLLEMVQAK